MLQQVAVTRRRFQFILRISNGSPLCRINISIAINRLSSPLLEYWPSLCDLLSNVHG